MIDKNNLSSFIRTVDSHEYIFENGNLLLKKYIHKKTKNF